MLQKVYFAFVISCPFGHFTVLTKLPVRAWLWQQ